MALPALNPHPFGCPIGLALNPVQMQAIVPAICTKLRELVHPTVHIVNPSKGQPYPMLNLHADVGEPVPRLVLFPGWEDATQTRRIGWKRQGVLMKRIHDAGVTGETLDPRDAVVEQDKPLVLCAAVTAVEMEGVVSDLFDYLGDSVRLTVGKINGDSGPPVLIVRIYALTAEREPRVILLPAWTSTDEEQSSWVDEAKKRALVRAADRVAEIPVEIFLRHR